LTVGKDGTIGHQAMLPWLQGFPPKSFAPSLKSSRLCAHAQTLFTNASRFSKELAVEPNDLKEHIVGFSAIYLPPIAGMP
jgi:hypothetical protein